MNGAVLLAQIRYQCDLNQDESQCTPTWNVYRIDRGNVGKPGFNYRYFTYGSLTTGNVTDDWRDLYKVYGVRLVCYVSGTGGKFDVATLFVTIGAGIGLLSVATLVTDLVMKRCTADKEVYVATTTKEVRSVEMSPPEDTPTVDMRRQLLELNEQASEIHSATSHYIRPSE